MAELTICGNCRGVGEVGPFDGSMIECQVCNGEGEYVEHQGHDDGVQWVCNDDCWHPDHVCPTCNGMDPEEYINDPPHTLCPTCKGTTRVEVF